MTGDAEAGDGRQPTSIDNDCRHMVGGVAAVVELSPIKRLIGGGTGSAAPWLVATPPAGASVLPLARWAHWDPGRGMRKTSRVGSEIRLYRI